LSAAGARPARSRLVPRCLVCPSQAAGCLVSPSQVPRCRICPSPVAGCLVSSRPAPRCWGCCCPVRCPACLRRTQPRPAGAGLSRDWRLAARRRHASLAQVSPPPAVRGCSLGIAASQLSQPDIPLPGPRPPWRAYCPVGEGAVLPSLIAQLGRYELSVLTGGTLPKATAGDQRPRLRCRPHAGRPAKGATCLPGRTGAGGWRRA